MSQAEFDGLLASVCREQGWKLDRNRVELSIEGGRHQGVEVEPFEFS